MGDVGDAVSLLGVTVVYSPTARAHDITALQLPTGSTVADAVRASGLPMRHATLADSRAWQVGVWGVRRGLDAEVVAGDRIELYRPLVVDPKEARRVRYRAQGERGRKPRIKALRVSATPAVGAAEPA